MSLASTIILIGPMGAGKSTIGRLLSEQLNIDFVDLDREIEISSGATIPWIFDIEGEVGFRKRESQVLKELLVDHVAVVLATGGGCILSESNRGFLAEHGIVIYLKASVEQQLLRTGQDKNRPLLQTEDPESLLTDMAAVRNPLYQELADFSIDTDLKSPRVVVHEIRQFISK